MVSPASSARGSWLVAVARHLAVDRLRRSGAETRALHRFAVEESIATADHPHGDTSDDDTIGDDRLRLIFTCCHPALSAGYPVLLEEQDRATCDSAAIAEGEVLIVRAEDLLRPRGERPGAYLLQAGIACLHATAPSFAATDAAAIVRCTTRWSSSLRHRW